MGIRIRSFLPTKTTTDARQKVKPKSHCQQMQSTNNDESLMFALPTTQSSSLPALQLFLLVLVPLTLPILLFACFSNTNSAQQEVFIFQGASAQKTTRSTISEGHILESLTDKGHIHFLYILLATLLVFTPSNTLL